jgi:hypothetical protein
MPSIDFQELCLVLGDHKGVVTPGFLRYLKRHQAEMLVLIRIHDELKLSRQLATDKLMGR